MSLKLHFSFSQIIASNPDAIKTVFDVKKKIAEIHSADPSSIKIIFQKKFLTDKTNITDLNLSNGDDFMATVPKKANSNNMPNNASPSSSPNISGQLTGPSSVGCSTPPSSGSFGPPPASPNIAGFGPPPSASASMLPPGPGGPTFPSSNTPSIQSHQPPFNNNLHSNLIQNSSIPGFGPTNSSPNTFPANSSSQPFGPPPSSTSTFSPPTFQPNNHANNQTNNLPTLGSPFGGPSIESTVHNSLNSIISSIEPNRIPGYGPPQAGSPSPFGPSAPQPPAASSSPFGPPQATSPSLFGPGNPAASPQAPPSNPANNLPPPPSLVSTFGPPPAAASSFGPPTSTPPSRQTLSQMEGPPPETSGTFGAPTPAASSSFGPAPPPSSSPFGPPAPPAGSSPRSPPTPPQAEKPHHQEEEEPEPIERHMPEVPKPPSNDLPSSFRPPSKSNFGPPPSFNQGSSYAPAFIDKPPEIPQASPEEDINLEISSIESLLSSFEPQSNLLSREEIKREIPGGLLHSMRNPLDDRSLFSSMESLQFPSSQFNMSSPSPSFQPQQQSRSPPLIDENSPQWKTSVNSIKDMGFPEEDAVKALRQAHGNADAAVEILLSGGLVSNPAPTQPPAQYQSQFQPPPQQQQFQPPFGQNQFQPGEFHPPMPGQGMSGQGMPSPAQPSFGPPQGQHFIGNHNPSFGPPQKHQQIQNLISQFPREQQIVLQNLIQRYSQTHDPVEVIDVFNACEGIEQSVIDILE
ncbi:hypothetical protein TRFO_25864 [Tritrichomonas foetus]|uniref:UBA domain-containing protein n=1 Tax=Tritrichomonas foetus TaxID=1144522 RepID=A0A1J4K5L6_9EUKA|nr:hypothetical protein TRFO_25864 [Tritrichomonas foetus]|eukprot:OHT06168.1 hypothetical protein TRFO_25864 [Tritrichomonas foetus]